MTKKKETTNDGKDGNDRNDPWKANMDKDGQSHGQSMPKS